MNLSKCLLITFLGVALLLAVSFLTLYLTRKSTREDSDDSGESELNEPKEISDKLEKQLEENRKEMMSELEKQRDQYLKVSQERFQADIQGIKNRYPDLGEKPIEIPKAIDLELMLDVNLPELGEVTYYKVKDQKITIMRGQRDEVVKFTHQRPVSTFNVSSVQIEGKSYPVPRVDDVLLLTSMSLLSDIRYPYFLMVSPSGKTPIIFENVGDRFVVLDRPVDSFGDAMREKAKEFGRERVKTPEPEPIPMPESEPEPVVPEEREPVEFNLTANENFKAGSLEFEANVADEFEKYTKYYYLDRNRGFQAKSFTANGEEQTGLPLNKDLHSILVYMLKGTKGPPLVVKVAYPKENEYYRNDLNNKWVPMDGSNLEASLDYTSSLVHDTVVLNLGRRSDYYRNGGGDSNVEETKDVNVYVDTDKPLAGWSTFIHKLEVEGDGHNFTITKLVFGDGASQKREMKKCKQVEVYMKSDDPTLIPKVICARYEDDTYEYLVFDSSSQYVPDSELTDEKLDEHLRKLSLQTEA
ncbi:hypothetical protein MACK_001772 [Theileria orientalis]|uniref:DUF4340 domain-containing protein n=1 Tax=Theileria orientalis TaxID=68886 RepID=A0A976QUG8_THEOR|nr:hypothetical protein MACK_001772 [Theileria orientalis]